MRTSDIITITAGAVGLAAFCCFLFYPYTDLDSIQEKTAIAMNCLYTVIASAVTLVATAIADRD